jgi:hypothetical protein
MSRPLPRYTTISTTEALKIDRILAQTNANETPTTITQATLPGDNRRLRGIPCIARGVGGTSPNTNPLRETIARDQRRRRAA